jgi:hypothetical protein
VTPFSLFEIGTIYCLQNNPKKASKKFNKVKSDYDNYEFRNVLLREVALWQDKSDGITYSSFTDNHNYDEVPVGTHHTTAIVSNTHSNLTMTGSSHALALPTNLSSNTVRVSPRFNNSI